MYLIEEKDVNMEMKLYNREPLHSNWLKSALNEKCFIPYEGYYNFGLPVRPSFLRSWNQVFKKSVVNRIRSSKIRSK